MSVQYNLSSGYKFSINLIRQHQATISNEVRVAKKNIITQTIN